MNRIRATLAFTLLLALSAGARAPAHAQARPLHYAEEFYLYVMNLYETNPSLERNIRFMQWALEAPFANQVYSLATITSVEDFRKYKALFRMHVNLLIIDSYLQLARRYDKRHVYFYNAFWFAEDLKESFTIARYYYEICYNYWDEAVRYAGEAAAVPVRLDNDAWEDELYLIESGRLDYRAIVGKHLEHLAQRVAIVDQYLEAGSTAGGPGSGPGAGTATDPAAGIPGQ